MLRGLGFDVLLGLVGSWVFFILVLGVEKGHTLATVCMCVLCIGCSIIV